MVQLTETAVSKVKEILDTQEPKPAGLRISVVGGGCSGFSYSMAFENAPGMLDKTYKFGDLQLFIDQASPFGAAADPSPIMARTTRSRRANTPISAIFKERPYLGRSCCVGYGFGNRNRKRAQLLLRPQKTLPKGEEELDLALTTADQAQAQEAETHHREARRLRNSGGGR
jgi:hypothetical protein